MQTNNRFPDPGEGLRTMILLAGFLLAANAAGMLAGVTLQWALGCGA